MAELVANCPRCGAQEITFDVLHQNRLPDGRLPGGSLRRYEAFCVCRRCNRSTVFVLSTTYPTFNARCDALSNAIAAYEGELGSFLSIRGFINQSDLNAAPGPEHVPSNLGGVFLEGSRCLAIGCFNAAGTMFRLCIDMATRSLLPAEGSENGPNAKQRRDLGLRLPWLFNNDKLPAGLHDLASCVKEDGNDGAHSGTLTQEEAHDLFDFTFALLERLYTEPERLRLAVERRQARRANPPGE